MTEKPMTNRDKMRAKNALQAKASMEAAVLALDAATTALFAAQDAWKIAKEIQDETRGAGWFHFKTKADEAYQAVLACHEMWRACDKALHATRFATL